MDVNEVLKFADEIVFNNTGKHLDDLEQSILRGVWQGHKYSKIAEESHRTESHVRDVASELWKLLSDKLGEDLTKSNFRATIERWRFSIVSSNYSKNFVEINNVKVCGEALQSPKVPQDRSHDVRNPVSPRNRVSVDNAPDVSSFYGRAEELNILKKWIVEERCRLVAIVGISGIGKTALAVKLLERIQDKFEYVIWQSLRYSPSLEAILRNLIQFLSDRSETDLPVSIADRLSLLMEYLRKSRCLIILDDVQMVLSSGQLAGNYKSGYEDYGEFFRTVAEFSHNSCLVMNSWEPPREILPLKGDTAPIRSLQLNGLGLAAVEILREQGLVEEDKWEYLIDAYAGNPLWLKIVATMIQELFRGKVSEFLKYDTLVLNEDLKAILHQQFNRLSELEKQVISRIGNESVPVSIYQLLENMQLSPSELFNGIQSLGRRSLIEKKEQSNETLFAVQPVVRQYVKTQYAGNDG
ncbi:NB-ARC domain-containing protein [Argonema galeatum]|uniref:NB-ARC domain-containing protein n=1 Tax=Argonema galeatum TaxID=2942762 RepID=UPI0020118ECB|nr:ATP-binding protein [Argonema galeatum]MCL1463067.1 ATP-binding protein [Argonema galeatum A003/A1]